MVTHSITAAYATDISQGPGCNGAGCWQFAYASGVSQGAGC